MDPERPDHLGIVLGGPEFMTRKVESLTNSFDPEPRQAQNFTGIIGFGHLDHPLSQVQAPVELF